MMKRIVAVVTILILSLICINQSFIESDSTNQQIIVDSGEITATIPSIFVMTGSTADELIEEFQNLEDGKIAFISGSSLDTVMYSDQLKLKNIIESGIPMIIKGDTSIIPTVGVSIVLNPNADCNAMYCDPITGTTYCFGVEGAGYQSIKYASEWLQDKMDSTSDFAQADIDFNDCIIYQELKICDDNREHFIATGMYSKIGSSNGMTYYAVQYDCETISSHDDWRTADITVSCDIDDLNVLQHLIDYGPDSTSGSTTTSVSVSMNAGTDLSVGSTIGWSYTMPSTVIHNQCDKANDLFKIWFDVDEHTADSTVRAKPGAIIGISSNGGVYSSKDVYTVQFEGPYYDHLFPWDPQTELRSFTLECNVQFLA